MPKSLSNARVRAYLAHWQIAAAAERRELRAASAEHKLRQVAALMTSAKALGWNAGVGQEAGQAREVWQRLRQAYERRDQRRGLGVEPQSSGTGRGRRD